MTSSPPVASGSVGGARSGARPVLLFDSGMGGLTVLAALRRQMPDIDCVYLADDEWFPYGALAEATLVARVVALIGHAIAEYRPVATVIACNTASTLVLPVLRSRFDCPFIGTVPAIKPAAASSRSRMVSVLATPATVERDYTRALIEAFAADCRVTLVGAPGLASHAERHLAGSPIDTKLIAEAIAPAFVQAGGLRTDTVVLACTHYPLILDLLEQASPWPVTWIDPAPAIARRVVSVLADQGDWATGGGLRVSLTSGKRAPAFAEAVLADLATRCSALTDGGRPGS